MDVRELLPGIEIRGRVAGEAEDEAGARTLLVLEGIDGTVLLVPQTPEIEEHRDRDEVLRGEIVTLRAIPAPPGRDRRVRVEVTRHGRLSELEAALEPSTFLDLEAVRAVREHDGAPPIDGYPRSFRRELREAIARRVPFLEQQGLLKVLVVEPGERVPRLAVARDAEGRIERAMRERDRGLTPLSEVERIHEKPVVHAKLEPGRVYQGRAVAMASDSEGKAHIILHTDSTLTAVPAVIGTLQVGREIRARAVAREVSGEQRWALSWQFDDLERERVLHLSRER
jgi:hypothetical protein